MNLIGRKISHIRCVDILGQGGMGEVYSAFDEKLKRNVAVKAIGARFHSDSQAKARFLREARVLSRLKHPHICQIYDYLEEKDGDFLILEFIDGKNLRRVIEDGIEKKPALKIAEQIALALVAAHEAGVIHRDLKPSNIMITRGGEVKILDFGIAGYSGSGTRPPSPEDLKQDAADSTPPGSDEPFIDPDHTLTISESSSGSKDLPFDVKTPIQTVETGHGTVLGTPLYMSPEQARGEPTSSAGDMYSFGLLLQHLFTGREPYEDISDKNTLLEQVRKAESRRVTGLSSDLTSFINRLKSAAPAARPTAHEALERLRLVLEKPKRRIRKILAASLLAVFLLAVLKYTIDLNRERQHALAARDEAAGVVDYLISLFEVSDPGESRGNTVTAREILSRGARDIEQDLQRQPLTRARLMDTIGTVYRKLGLYPEAEPLIHKALKIRRENLSERDPLVAESLLSLAMLNEKQGRYAAAETLAKESLSLRESFFDEEHPLIADSLLELGRIQFRRGSMEDADRSLHMALSIREKSLGPRHPDVAAGLHELGILYYTQGRYEEAETLYRRALSIREAVLGDDHPDVSRSLNSLGALLARKGQYEEAESLYRKALSIREKTLGEIHPEIAIGINNVAHLYYQQGRYRDAETLYTKALEIREQALGAAHPDVAENLICLANISLMEWQLEKAEGLYLRALSIREKVLKPDHPDIAICWFHLATLYLYQNNLTAAEENYLKALAVYDKTLEPDHPDIAECLNGLAYVYTAKGNLDKAEPLYLRALNIKEKNLGPDHLDLADLLDSTGTLYEKKKDYRKAEGCYLRALNIRESHPGADPGGEAITLSNLAVIYHRFIPDLDKAEEYYKRAVSVLENFETSRGPGIGYLVENYADLLTDLNRTEEAKKLRERHPIKDSL
ncbi:MAG: serine/threonine-protein kinase [Candidatus Aminicenantes bacterium]|nr:serine/threonine-protein kinase [Candidatus Aminicenantes bacterium]